MINVNNKWQKLGQIASPSRDVSWMFSHTGATAVLPRHGSLVDLHITGRDNQNRSIIGKGSFDLDNISNGVEITESITLSYGELGCFDENGVSYPYFVSYKKQLYLYYTGWMQTVKTPFQNHLGLAILKDGSFERVSKAPILPRNEYDYLSIGSACVIVDGDEWKMWYTSFLKWGVEENEPKHSYVIKYASSKNGIDWQRKNQICISPVYDDEHSIGRPTVIKKNDLYHMWFCYRGAEYRIGYAYSEDGISWTRADDLVGITVSSEGWDSESITYPYVFEHRDDLYMIYCGNEYGRGGLGIAKLSLR